MIALSSIDMPRALILAPALALALGCGPGKASSDSSAGIDVDGEGSDDEAGTTADSSASSDGVTTFVPESDLGSTPTGCDPFAQDCPDGEKCVPYSSTSGTWDANKCVPIQGDQATGEPCVYDGVVDATDDCDGQSMCWNAVEVDGELVGTCHAFCEGSPDNPTCPDAPSCEGQHCTLSGSGVINLCIPNCDALAQDCGEGLACYWVGYTFQCVFTTTDLPTGAPCHYLNDCAPGNACVSADQLPGCDGTNCCAAFCDPEAAPDPCAVEGTSCQSDYFDAGEFCPTGLCLATPP